MDDGKGALASAFSVCVTKNLHEKPSCDYTASLIARDDKLDISMLRIDPVDIYGNAVDYKKFKRIDVDFSYEPRTQDETVAIGYPWIGADTITETKGIVSGVSDHNGYKYIKTDTLIAGGNSGGAFTNKEGKLIGIPTFGIGGWGDSSMGYALSIKEAKSFIEENMVKPSQRNKVTDTIDFNTYRKTIESINAAHLVKDDVFRITFPADYEIINYRKNSYVEMDLKKQKDTGVTLLKISTEKSPKLDTQRKVLYYLESIGFFSKDYQKLLKKTIGGIDFYYAVETGDLSNGDSYWGKSYKAIVNGQIISLEVQAPLYDEKRNKEVKKEVDMLLSGISIQKENLGKIDYSFSTNIPKIDIARGSNSITDTGKYRIYFGKNLYEYLDINLNELIEYNGKGKTADEIYDVHLKDVDVSEKAKVKFHGLDGYINCSSNAGTMNYYNVYGYYSSNGSSSTDEYGNPLETASCQINIFFPLDKELNRQNYLSIDVQSESAKIQENLAKAISFLTKNLKIAGTDTEVNIPNVFAQQVKLKFTDIDSQSIAYKNFLQLLVRYGAIENSEKFDGDKAMTWGEYLSLYAKWVYNIDLGASNQCKTDYVCTFSHTMVERNGTKVSLHSIFQDMDIPYGEYVDSDRLDDFQTVFAYELAGVDIGGFNDRNIALFQAKSNEKQYINETKKLNDLNNRIYGVKKILLSDFYSNYDTAFLAETVNKFSFKDGALKQEKQFNGKKTSFSNKKNDTYQLEAQLARLEDQYACIKKTSFKSFMDCTRALQEQIKKVRDAYKDIPDTKESYYPVLSKAEALENIFTQVDFGLFDKELAKKKDNATLTEEKKEEKK